MAKMSPHDNSKVALAILKSKKNCEWDEKIDNSLTSTVYVKLEAGRSKPSLAWLDI